MDALYTGNDVCLATIRTKKPISLLMSIFHIKYREIAVTYSFVFISRKVAVTYVQYVTERLEFTIKSLGRKARVFFKFKNPYV